MRIKIRGGTASSGEPSLCLTCRFATVVKGASLRDEIVECSRLSYGRNRITFPVTVCTEYSDRRQPSLRAMEEIAWVLRSDSKKKDIGFVKRTELTRRETYKAADCDPVSVVRRLRARVGRYAWTADRPRARHGEGVHREARGLT
jgi:hypothetical protein